MLAWLEGLLRSQPILLFVVVVAAGHLIGKIGIGKIRLGGVAGVLFTALVFGHFGYEGAPILQTLGFALFMYMVGYEAGPQFFAVVLKDGTRYLLLALSVASAGVLTTLAVDSVSALPPGASAGVLAGGMTTTPTLAAAQDAVAGGQVALPAGVTTDSVLTNIGAAYAITYLFGLVGLLLIIKIMPRLLKIDIAGDARAMERAAAESRGGPEEPVQVRAYRVRENDRIVGETRNEFESRYDRRVYVEKLRRDGEFVEPSDDTTIVAGDEVTLVGFLSLLQEASHRGAGEIDDPEMLDLDLESAQVVVTRGAAAGVTLAELGLEYRFGAMVQDVVRQGVRIDPAPALRLQRGDVLRMTAPGAHWKLLGDRLGHVEREVEQSDLVTYMLGVALGLIVGSVTVAVGGMRIGLGMAGGLLLVGVLVGFLRSIHPTFGRLPTATRWTTKELGLLLFMAGVGLQAGSGIVETLRTAGLSLFVGGMAVTIVPVVAAWVVGRYLLGFRPALLMGAVTGAMTNTASLKIVCEEADSSAPALGYAGAYAFACILLTVAGGIIVRLTV